MVLNDSKQVSNVVETNSKLIGTKFYDKMVEVCL